MKFFDVVTIGSATRDALFKSKDFCVMPTPPDIGSGEALVLNLGSKIPIDHVYFSTGGAGTNTAVTFARQGFRVASIVNVGDDPGGRAILTELKKEKVDTSLIQTDTQTHTAYSVILEPASGERVILNYRGANDHLRKKIIPFSRIKTRWFYLSSLSGDIGILRGALSLKKKYGVRIAWNPGGNDLSLGFSRLAKFLNMVDVFIVNQEEAADLLGVPYHKTDAVFKKFDEVIDGIAVMTRGPRGVFVSDGKTIWQAGIFKEKKVADRTGAGDSFGSGFVSGLIRKIKQDKSKTLYFDNDMIEYALRLGSANATSKVEHVGAKGGLLTKKEFENNPRWSKLPFSSRIIEI